MLRKMTYFRIGAVLGLLAVAAGAFGTHALEGRLAPDRLEQFELAARYQIYHAFALLATGFAHERYHAQRAALAGKAFLLGIAIFCGTVYALAFGSPRWFGAITPIGGLSLMAGWLLLALSASKRAEV